MPRTFSDTSIGYRYGTEFAEPFNNNAISKDIINLNHVSGYKYGTNFFNVDMLLSDNKDPVAQAPAMVHRRCTSSTATRWNSKNSLAHPTNLAPCAASA
jgi:hypothetical protein